MYSRGTLVYILMGLFLIAESTDPTDECDPNPCKHGTCTDGDQSFTCTCDVGYTADTCCSNIDDCANNPCVNGQCIDGIASYTCACTAGYTGDTCDININDCEPNPCNDGTCTDGVNSYTCTCLEGIIGNCDIKQCYDTPTPYDYVGKYDKTETGRTCQRWDSNEPHSHGFKDPSQYPDDTVADAQNYCRDPANDEGYLWCYTTDSNKRWERCDLGRCACYKNGTAKDYAGTWNVTVGGIPCQRWDNDTIHSHSYDDPSSYPDDTVADAGNSCRDPNGDEGYLWCYTTDANKRWDSCDINECKFSWQ